MARDQTHFWTVEDCDVVTATETLGRLSQAEVAESDREDPWEGSGYLILGATPVHYVATPCPFGGGRFWFLCPGCGRRVYKLYAPLHGGLYACRLCHDLTYESRRRGHRRWDNLLQGLKLWGELAIRLRRRGRRPKRVYRLLARLRAIVEAMQTLEELKRGTGR